MPKAITSLGNNAPLLLALAALIWGGNSVAGKFAVGEVSPLLLTAARWSISLVILSIVARRHLVRDWPVIRQRWAYLFSLGIVGFSLFNGLLYTSLHYTTAINATIIQAGMPMIIFILNFIVFRVHVHWAQALGYSLTLVGVALTAAGGDLTSLAGLAINKGDVIMLVGALFYSIFSVALRSKPDMHWLSFLTCLVFAAALTAIPMALYESTTPFFVWPTTVTGWTVIAYAALLPSILAQAFYIRGIELLGGNRASLYLNLVPIFGAVLAVLLVNEVFHLYHAVALALVIGGIVFAQQLSKH